MSVKVKLVENGVAECQAVIEMPTPPTIGMWVRIPWRGRDYFQVSSVYWCDDEQVFEADVEPSLIHDDPARAPVVQCSICRRCGYMPELLDQPCHYENKKIGRKCFGTFRPYRPSANCVGEIDGDKVIAFINAVKGLGEILDHINVIGVAEVWRMGKQVKAINTIIAQETEWKRCIETISEDLRRESEVLEANRTELKAIVQFCRSAGNNETKAGLAILKQLSEVLDDLETHRQSGLLAAVATLPKGALA